MDLKKRLSLRDLIANRNKEATSLGVPRTQTSVNPSLPSPPSPANLGPCVNPDSKKKRPP